MAAALLSSLDAAYAFTRDTPRKRSRQEAHWKLNRAYFDLIFAWGYAQVPNKARSAELLEQARAALPSSDPIHQTALQAFELRIRERNPSPWTRLTVDLAPLKAIERYRVTRLFEALAILSRVEFLDAIASFWRNRDDYVVVPPSEDVVTRVLVADGEGRIEDVRMGLDAVFASSGLCGAVLLGPCRRAGREARLKEWLQQHRQESPSAGGAALEALGVGEPAQLPLEAFGPHAITAIQSARSYIGARALSGHADASEALAREAWAEATDSFNTNESFTLMALVVCETIVLSVLRHELALGNRSLLEPINPPPAPRQTTAPIPVQEEDERALLYYFARALREVATFEGRFRELSEKLESLVPNSREQAPSRPYLSLSELISELKSAAGFVESSLEAADGEQLTLCKSVEPILRAVLALIDELERTDPYFLARKRVLTSLVRVEVCLRSYIVERPRTSKALFERIAAAREALSFLRHVEPESNERAWMELPVSELVASIRADVEVAGGELPSLTAVPEFADSVRECLTLVTELMPELSP